jgi:hypothetical protein
MPLSEHEQRLLDQIERELYAEDPKFASAVRGSRSHRPTRRRRIQGAALLLVGIALLVVGLIIPFRVGGVPLMSVVGFPVMFFGALLAIASSRHQSEAVTSGSKSSVEGKNHPSRNSLAHRMEERFRRRMDER